MKHRPFLLLIIIYFCVCLNPVVVWCDNTNNRKKNFTIDSWGNGSPALEIILPATFVFKKHKGPDFDVHYFTDSITGETLAIYIGHHPRMDKIAKEEATEHYVGNILTTFYSKKSENKVSSQSIVKGFFNGQTGDGVADLLMHIVVTGDSDKFTQKIFKYLKKLKIKKNMG